MASRRRPSPVRFFAASLVFLVVAVGAAGAHNAGLYAVAMLALSDPSLAARLAEFRRAQTARVLEIKLPDPS